MLLFSLFSWIYCDINFVQIFAFDPVINLNSEMYLWGSSRCTFVKQFKSRVEKRDSKSNLLWKQSVYLLSKEDQGD